MQQTILALAAILIFSLYSLSRHRADAGTEQIAVSAELETAAAGLARARLHEVARRAFDEADIGRDGIRSSPNGLTHGGALGPETGEGSESSFDDLDDFNGFARPVTSSWNGQTLQFRDSVSVRYVNPDDPSLSPTRSLAKEVTVHVVSQASGDGPPAMARLRRIITPASGTAHSGY